MSLHSLFSPRSIAVIGASTTPGSVGHDIAKNLIESDYSGTVHLVNPKTNTLLGQPCYPSLDAITGEIELVIIVVPAKIVPAVLREAGERRVRAAVIISAGFKESGQAGSTLESEIQAIAAEFHIAVLGPNCLGFIHPSQYLNASFASSIPAAGSIAFLSQSGALSSAFLDLTHGRLGFSLFISIGNKAVIDEPQLLDYLSHDEGTHTIGMYTENIQDAATFISLGRKNLKAKRSKPMIVLKSGSTTAGTQASSSHTGAIAGSDAAYTALFRQAKMFRVGDFETLMDYLLAFNQNSIASGNRLAIVTNAGGLGVLATDEAIQSGLSLAELNPETKAELRALLPPAASVNNPVDVLGDALADRYATALQLVAQDEHVDLLLVILTPQTMTEAKKTAEAIVELRARYPKLPIATVFSGHALVENGQKLLQAAQIPNFLYPETGAQVLGALAQFGNWRQNARQESSPIFERDLPAATALWQQAQADGQFQWGEQLTEKFLRCYKFPFLQSQLLHSSEEALDFAQKLGRPIALKIASPDIIHKSDVGGVLLNVLPEEADAAYAHLLATVEEKAPQASIEGVLGVEMAAPGGRELLLGLKREPGLGTLVVVGLGGIHVETFKDIAMRFAPLLPSDIDEMLDELQSLPLLLGARGEAGIDLAQLKEYIARLSQVAIDFPDIVELDINPLLAFPDGASFRILDSRLRIAGKQ